MRSHGNSGPEEVEIAAPTCASVAELSGEGGNKLDRWATFRLI